MKKGTELFFDRACARGHVHGVHGVSARGQVLQSRIRAKTRILWTSLAK